MIRSVRLDEHKPEWTWPNNLHLYYLGSISLWLASTIFKFLFCEKSNSRNSFFLNYQKWIWSKPGYFLTLKSYLCLLKFRFYFWRTRSSLMKLKVNSKLNLNVVDRLTLKMQHINSAVSLIWTRLIWLLFSRLNLPPYESYQQLHDRLIMAIEECEGFGLN